MKSAFASKKAFVFWMSFVMFGLIGCTGTLTTPTSEPTTTPTTTLPSETTSSTTLTGGRTVTSISLSEPSADPFYPGEFTPASVTVLIHYDDETTEPIPMSLGMLSSADIALLNVPGTHVIVLTYEGRHVDLEIVVLEPLLTLTFHLDGGTLSSGVEESFEDLAKGTVVTLPEPTKPGFQFMGWYADPEWMTGPLSEEHEIETDQELYAKWIENALVVASLFEPILEGGNHRMAAVITVTEDRETLWMEMVTTVLATVEGHRTENSVTDRIDYSSGSPVVMLGYHSISTIDIDGFRYVFETGFEEESGTFTRYSLIPKGLQGTVNLESSPFALLDPSGFVPRIGDSGYSYQPIADELAQFVKAIYDGEFRETEVTAVLTADPFGLLIQIPLAPYDVETDEWPSVITVNYLFSEFGTATAAFPYGEAAASVMQELTLFVAQKIVVEMPTADSETAFLQELTDAETILGSLTGADDLFDFQQTQMTALSDFLLVPDPVKWAKLEGTEQVENQWGLWAEIATDASLTLMQAEYETMMAELSAAETEAQVDAAIEDGLLSIQLVFIEDPAKAAFVGERSLALANLNHFQILVLMTVSPSDPGYGTLLTLIDDAKEALSQLTPLDDPLGLYSTRMTGILAQYHLCVPLEPTGYRDSIARLIDQIFFNYVTGEEEFLWDAMTLFADAREDAHAALLSASNDTAAWGVFVDYLQTTQEIADQEWRQALLDEYYGIVNYDFYSRLDSAFSGAFVEGYVLIRDHLTHAVLSVTFPILDAQFRNLLDTAVLDPLKDAKRDAIKTIQNLLILRNPIATSESQSAMYGAQTTGYNALYAATTISEVNMILGECLGAIEAAYVVDLEKAALANARASALAELEDYLEFSNGFVEDYGRYDEILLIGFEAILWISGQYTVAEVNAHLAEFYADVAAVGYTPDSEKIEGYRIWAHADIAAHLGLLTTVPQSIADDFAAANLAIASSTDPFEIRDIHDGFIAKVNLLL